ncbi:hypothetical protein K8R42_05160, partial [bacterium]|nr:hypothetical protein [bacterium]
MRCKFLCSSLLMAIVLLSSSISCLATAYININLVGPFEIYYIGDLDPVGRGSGAIWLAVDVYGIENVPTTITLDFSMDGRSSFSGTTNALNFANDVPLS